MFVIRTIKGVIVAIGIVVTHTAKMRDLSMIFGFKY